MRTESHPQEDSPATLAIPGSAPRFPWSVTEVEALSGFRLRVAFADGHPCTFSKGGGLRRTP